MVYSGSGDAGPADRRRSTGGDRSSTSGCEAADFAGFTAGNIALIQRGTCSLRIEADNAAAAGAAASSSSTRAMSTGGRALCPVRRHPGRASGRISPWSAQASPPAPNSPG